MVVAICLGKRDTSYGRSALGTTALRGFNIRGVPAAVHSGANMKRIGLLAAALLSTLAAHAHAQRAPVDLLGAVRTDIAVSSVYRDQAQQATKLVDGDIETAWNSRTGDLVGAWIEVRVPATSTVTAIALTAGFTRVSEGNDLFTGNHRIRRVRVLRDGTEIAAANLDPESRELQSVPVSGGGGVYRIEVLEVLAGTRRNWRELCISELRVMGRDAGAQNGLRFPRVSVGRLPDPRPEPGTADRAQISRALRDEARTLARTWRDFERQIFSLAQDRGNPEPDGAMRASFGRAHRSSLTRAADFVDLVDGVRADALRRAAAQELEWGSLSVRESARTADLALFDAAFEAVASWTGDDAARCEWASVHAGIRANRIWNQMRLDLQYAEVSGAMDGEPSRAELRRLAQLERASEAMQRVVESWSNHTRSAATQLERIDLSPAQLLAADREALTAALRNARASCHWE
jgi:hypothetical protein